MTTLDNATLQWVIENISGHEHDGGPSSNTLSFREGDYFKDYTLFTARDIREWLADLMHRIHATFFPESSLRNDDELPTHIKAICSCGEWEGTVELNISEERPYEGFEREVENIAADHAREAKEALLARYQWE